MTTSWRKKPWVAMCKMLGAVLCLMAPSVALACVNTVAPGRRVWSTRASSAVPGSGLKESCAKSTTPHAAAVRGVVPYWLDTPLLPPVPLVVPNSGLAITTGPCTTWAFTWRRSKSRPVVR